MLRGSEVLKDSYHSPVKKIKTIKNLQPNHISSIFDGFSWRRSTVYNSKIILQGHFTVVLVYVSN